MKVTWECRWKEKQLNKCYSPKKRCQTLSVRAANKWPIILLSSFKWKVKLSKTPAGLLREDICIKNENMSEQEF
jgi:hypothetical protein